MKNRSNQSPVADLVSLGDHLRRLRSQAGLGLAEAVVEVRRRAPRVHLSTSSLSRLERGEGRTPNGPLLKALADTYGARYHELVLQVVEKIYGVDPLRGPESGGAQRGEGQDQPSITSIEENLSRLDAEGLSLVADLVSHLATRRSYFS